jgi:hypothetical protein
VPQVALQIFRAIQAYEHGTHPQEQQAITIRRPA